MTYLDPDVLSNETDVAEAKLAAIADRIPGWEPHNGHVVTAYAEADSAIDAAIATLLRDEARDAYSGFGQNILGLDRRPASVATGVATFTLRDSLGHTIPDGTELVLERPDDGTPIAFATVGDFVVELGAAVAEDVPITALEPGPAANGLSGIPRDVDDLTFVEGVEVGASTAGGADAELIDDYVARVARHARRYRALPIVTTDYAAMSLDVAGVARCVAVNLLDWSAGSGSGSGDEPDALGHVTVFPLDDLGQPSDGATAIALAAYLEGAERPMPVSVHVGTADFTPFDVEVSVRLEAGADEAATSAGVEAAVAAYFDPAGWGFDAAAAGLWRNDGEPVRHYDVAHVADSVEGVAGVVAVSFDDGIRSDLVEIALTGWAPLPDVGAVTVVIA